MVSATLLIMFACKVTFCFGTEMADLVDTNADVDSLLEQIIDYPNDEYIVEQFRHHYDSVGDEHQMLLLDKIAEYLSKEIGANNYHSALTLSKLYLSVTGANDTRRQTVLYILGSIYYALEDAPSLHATIDSLMVATVSGQEDSEQIQQLLEYHEKLSSRHPSLDILLDPWVSNLDWEHSDVPYVVMCGFKRVCHNADDQQKNDNGDSLGVFFDTQCVLYKDAVKMMGYVPQISQIVRPFDKDSVYILWSSEDLHIPKEANVASMRNTIRNASTTAYGHLNQHNNISFGTELLGKTLVTGLETGLNMMVSQMSTPTKTIFLAEAKLKLVNDYHMKGGIFYRVYTYDAKGNLMDFKAGEFRVYDFYRWWPNTNDAFINKKYTLSNDLDTYFEGNHLTKSDINKKQNTFYEMGKLFKGKVNPSTFNSFLFDYICIYDDNELKKRGIKDGLYGGVNASEKATLDIKGETRVLKSSWQNEYRKEKALYITSDRGITNMLGLRRSYIISIDDEDIETMDDYRRIMRKHKPGDMVRVTWLKKGKYYSTKIPLSRY